MSDTSPIAAAGAADLPLLLRLEALFPGDRLSARQFRYHLRRPGSALRLATSGEQALGYALTLFRRDSAAARLYSIVVASVARGSGLGRRLLLDAEALARARGAQSLRLEVRTDNAAALALYRSAGYREFERRRAYYEDGGDAVRLSREL